MTLAYQTTKTTQHIITVKLTAPKRWACYTAAADRAMHQRAKRFLTKLEGLLTKNASPRTIENAFIAFIKSHSRFTSTNTGFEGGAGDTEVRNHVFAFLDNARQSVDLSYAELETLWERHVD